MLNAVREKLQGNILELGGMFTVLGIAIPTMWVNFSNDLPNRWLVTGILLVYFGMFFLQDRICYAFPGSGHLYLFFQSLLIITLIFLPPRVGSYLVIVFYVLSVQAMILFPEKVGLSWIGVFILITGVALYLVEDLQSMLITLPIYSGGFLFFAAFALQTVQAEKARAKSDELLADLKAAHQKLQAYARQAEAFAVADERNRLAREMHDTVGHRLTVSAVQLEGAQRLIPSEPDRAEKMVGTVREQVREALKELRAAVARLRAPLEADLGLTQALDRLSTNFSGATGITVHVAMPEDLPDLPASHRLALYRSAQEALTNIQKHAQASEAWLTLTLRDKLIELAIVDDGIGLSTNPDNGGFGLLGLRERAARVGGELVLTPREGGGAQVLVQLPWDGETAGG